MSLSWPRRLSILVSGTAAAVLLTEIILTRLFSVLLFYHFSFLAVALALFGLAAGGLLAARDPGGADRTRFERKVRSRLLAAGAALAAFAALLAVLPITGNDLIVALCLAILSALPLVFLGEVLARALALGRERIHRLYGLDLIASGAAALAVIPLLERVQGPAVLLVPAAGALLLAHVAGGRPHWTATAAAALLSLVAIAGATRPGPLWSSADAWVGRPVLERWNAHSRVRVGDRPDGTKFLTIDRTAGSLIPHVPATDSTGQPPTNPAWPSLHPDPSYLLGRDVARVAIIGVGGGVDLLPALAAGAQAIDGYEINGRIVELLTRTLQSHTALARRPEVQMIHQEARHGLKHSPGDYDVIRASLIDTWAATAAGGFVLSENGLYTVEGWRLFLRRLSPSGVLVMTRWYLPAAPAEAERLVALAAQALEEEGVASPSQHVVALALPSTLSDPLAGGEVRAITTLTSRQPFVAEEVRALEAFAARQGGVVLVAPGREAALGADSWLELLSPETRAARIHDSPWAIDPPRDTRPFFFLQLRAPDALMARPSQFATGFGPVSEITVNGVRILMLGVILAAIGGCLLILFAKRLIPPGAGLQATRGRGFFAMLGIGYMAIQLALHQRLSIVLGHPTATLALVIAAMLLGTGLGSWAAGADPLRRSPRATLAIPLLATLGLALGFGVFDGLTDARSTWGVALAAGVLSAGTGAALGVALPTGMRLFARGETAVAEAWAINGGFSVAGSALGALVGLLLGSRGLVAIAVPCYAVAWLLARRPAAWIQPSSTAGAPSVSESATSVLRAG